MKIWVGDDCFDSEVIAFIRKLKKRTKDFVLPDDRGTIPGKTYVMQLKHGYSLAGNRVNSIFLSDREGESVIEQLRGTSTESKENENAARKVAGVDPNNNQGSPGRGNSDRQGR
jgi:hypothetical protein